MEDDFMTPVIIKVESLANKDNENELVRDPLSIESYAESSMEIFIKNASKPPKFSLINLNSSTNKSGADLRSYILEPKIELNVFEYKIPPISNPCVSFSKHDNANPNCNSDANIMIKHEPNDNDLDDGDDDDGTGRNTNQKRKFICQLCSKIFQTGTYLRKHIETHKSAEDRERRFICSVCAASFLYIHHLNDHIKRHVNALSFKCPEQNCKRAFNIKSDLSSHYTTHTNSKTFECPHSNCSKTFKYKRSAKAHVQQFHTTTIRQFKCNEDTDNCSKAYVTSNQLQVHQRSAHKKKATLKNNTK